MAANERLSIRFEAVGAKNLQNAINAVALASDRLMLSTRKYDKALAKLNKRQNAAVNKMFDIQTATRNTGNAFSVLRSKMLLVSFAFLIVGNSIGKLLKASGDLEELMNKATVVFGAQIGMVESWANSLGNAIGRSTSSIIEMATTLQDTFVPLGFTREAATNLSTSLTRLAIDVASFNNQADDQVIKDFQSAIVGNHMTVRKYGIVLTQAALKQEGLTLGLIKGNQQLTTQQKVIARLSLIRKGSKDADNDAMITAGSFQNQIKALNAELEESAQFFGGAAKAVVTFGFQLGNAHISLLGLTRQLARREVMVGAATGIAVIGGAMLKTNLKAIKLGKTFKVLKTIFGKSHLAMFALFTLITAGVTLFQKFVLGSDSSTESLESQEEAMKKAAEAAGLLAEGSDGYAMSVSKSVTELEKKINKLKAVTDIEKHQVSITHEITQVEIDLLVELKAVNEEYDRRQKAIKGIQSLSKKDAKKALEEARNTQVAFKERRDFLIDSINKGKEAKKAEEEAGKKAAQQFLEGTKTTKKSILDTENLNDVILETYNPAQIEAWTDELENANIAIERQGSVIKKAQIAVGEETPIARLAEAFRSEVDMISDEISRYEELMAGMVNLSLDKMANLKDSYLNFAEVVVSTFTAMNMARAKEDVSRVKSIHKAELQELKNTRKYQKASAAQKEEMEQDLEKKNNERMRKAFKAQKMANKASVTMDFAMAVMKSASKAPFAAPAYYSILSAMYLAQLELINTAKAPVMQYGGLVGGNSHAQGGTMVEAERGEFVINKQAVDSVGLETLNKLNSGESSSGSINISFQGNVLSQDFIEEEALPQIKEALRRGADLGIS